MKKTALIFPGQGSQYVGMGKEIYSKNPEARLIFEEACDVLKFDIKKLCFEGNMEELTKTENTQPAILTCSMAAFKVFLQEFDIVPEYLAGHSLGEFSALSCSGALEFSDALKIVRQRGKFMQEAAAAGTGAMAAVSGVQKELLEQECKNCSSDEDIVVISNYNSPEQIVVSGSKRAVDRLGEKLEKTGASIIPLKVSAPFHSPLMQSAAEKLKEELSKYTFRDFGYKVISNVTAKPYEDRAGVAELLTLQMTRAVQWEDTMKYMHGCGINTFVEIGPKTVLKNLAKKNISDSDAFSFDKEEDVVGLNKHFELDGNKANSSRSFMHTVVSKCIEIAVCTKNRNWDNDEYQKGVLEPYRAIKKIQEELDNQKKEPSHEQMHEALEMLKSILMTKKLPLKEQEERFDEIFDDTNTRHLFPDYKILNEISG